MADETNGDKKGRLDGIEETLKVLVNNHTQFQEEQRQLLEKMATLIGTVDQLIRRPPLQ